MDFHIAFYVILTAWSAAGIVGPTFTVMVRERTKDYSSSFMVFAFLFFVALLVSLCMKINIRKISQGARIS
jgi:MFS transporter, OFA family, oxalate/formate antiporter